jgi:hypothetical protein
MLYLKVSSIGKDKELQHRHYKQHRDIPSIPEDLPEFLS